MKKLIEEIISTLNFKFPYEVDDYAEHLYLENYHCHKDNSNWIIADSPESIENYAERIKELGTKCLYSGEHGTQGNQFLTYKVAENTGLKYRHSTEAYWVKDRHEKDKTNCHIVLVAKNAEGRKDINYILSVANEDGYYYRPRIDLELLLSVPKDNVIVTSACLAGWLYEDADEIWLKIAEHFKENFFFEVQYHNTDVQKDINKRILRLARENNIQIICGLDSHYINDAGQVKRNQILKYKKIEYPEEEGWYMDYPDTPTVIQRFRDQGVLSDEEILRAIMNTNVFVNECEEIVLDKKFKIPNIYKDKTYSERCNIYKKILNNEYKKEILKSKEKEDGIRYEASQIIDSGVVDYCLVSKAIIDEAVNNQGGILTTTSRGSAASFITNKLLGFTTVDRFNTEIPIYPERFLTKERVDAGMMPDVDSNICEQEPFVKAARKLLGEHGCYPLMAVEKLKEKAAWQLYAGANDVEPQIANTISSYIDEYNKALKHADDDMKDMVLIENFIPAEYIETYMKSRDYQGININLKVHACGHLILDGDIRREIGLISAVSETTGKRTLCAAVEGNYLDEFGYVKQDFLIVDSVSLTYKFFKSIGQSVPTFEELKKMVDGDKTTWDIYAKGITCCVNQCESIATTQKVMKYKPQSVAELSAFIAGIRPGFASLLSTFLNREPYSTGEERIDKLLEDTSNFMLYQESIMKVLSFLHMPMGETYGVIKAISKKKLKGEKKEHLMQQLMEAWQEEFGNLDNFDAVWNVIEDSAAYAFNAPHAYSMCGDSLYQAWFKAHHTKEFYEVAIEHYRQKGKKDKIDALIKEAIKFYGYKLGTYRFGSDNRTVHIDGDIIYPNLSSVKGMGDTIVEQLYEAGQTECKTFLDVLKTLKEHSVGKAIIDKLIKIDYFSDYGNVYYLSEYARLYELLYKTKEISKEKVEKLGIPFEILRECGNETEKKFNKIDSKKLFNIMVSDIEDRELSAKEILDNQREILGLLSYIDESASFNHLYVQAIDSKKSVTNILLYEIKTGKNYNVKMWTSSFAKHSFEEGAILNVTALDKKHKKEFSGQLDENGKRIYVDTPEWEYWLSKYTEVRNYV